jgi:GNAT superfamily N-acetyltransferase
MEVQIFPATADRFDDVATLLKPKREDVPACWCLTYRLTSSEFSVLKGKERPAYLQDLCTREHAPGILAYLDGVPVGWCAFGLRSEMGRLVRSRTIPKVDDTPVWSIVCFVVRPGYRRKGVASKMLEGAIDYASSCGARMLEAYPVETEGERINGSFAYVGTTGMFEKAGFGRVMQTTSQTSGKLRWIMRLEIPASTLSS